MAQNQIPPSNPWNKHPASNPWNMASASASTSASPSTQPHPVTASLRDIMDEQTNEAKNMGNQRTSQGHPLRYGLHQAKKCPQTCAKCADSDNPAHAQSFQSGLYSPLIHSMVSNNSVSGQWRPWSDCADAQADLGLRCPHMPEDVFFRTARHTL